MAAQFRKKPVVVEAVQLRWDTWNEVCEFLGIGDERDPMMAQAQGVYVHDTENTTWTDAPGLEGYTRLGCTIPTLEGVMLAVETDWIVKGTQGEFYPVKPEIFAEIYEAVTD